MNVNPFELKPKNPELSFRSLAKQASKPYDKNQVDPYTKVRIILMNGTEFEANAFSHNFARHVVDNDLRRDLAVVRRIEQQQQKALSSLKPMDEDILEHTIGYEQLAVDLTAIMAQNEPDKHVKKALDFALLEDFDHLYRFADMLEFEQGIQGERLVGSYTEIMPGRPTVSEHRHPFDDIKKRISCDKANPQTKLNTMIITAAEQQTMNYYMNIGNHHPTELGRKLYAEIAMIEEQHVSEYGSLLDTNCTWLENWVMHEYTECYLYYSCMADEHDPEIKKLYETLYYEECGHLQKAAEMLEKHEGKHWSCLFPCGGNFPKLLKFNGNIEYIREVLKDTVCFTKDREGYIKASELNEKSDFKKYNKQVNKNESNVASHVVIDQYIKKNKKDYRYQLSEHPIKELQNRNEDNTCIGRC